MLLFKILFFHPNIVICFSTSSPIGLSDMSKCCLCPREAVPNRSPQKEWRSWHQSHTTPPPTADEIFQRGHLPPPLRFYGVPTHVDSLKWAWQLKNIKSVCVFKNNLWLGIKKWLLNKNRIYFFASVYFFFLFHFSFLWRPHTCKDLLGHVFALWNIWHVIGAMGIHPLHLAAAARSRLPVPELPSVLMPHKWFCFLSLINFGCNN